MTPSPIDTQLNEGLRMQQAGRFPEALAHYEAVLAAQPDHPDALHLSGLLLSQMGRPANEALERVWQAVGMAPTNTIFLGNFALLLSQNGRHEHAAAVYRRVLALDPRQSDMAYNLGNVLRDLKRLDEAEAAYRQAIALRPAYPKALLNLSHLLEGRGAFEEAEQVLRQALAVDPHYVNAMNNLGNIVRQLGRPEEAVACLRRALALDPTFYRAWNNLASALRETQQTEEAVAAYRQALALHPDYPEARMNMGMSLLALGQYEEGWEAFEYRWIAAKEMQGYVRNFPQPQWKGQPLAGKTIFAHAEQGFGDALQFFRYIPMLRDLGAKVVVEAQPELVRLFALTPGLVQVMARGEQPPAFDFHCPFMSLPLAFGTTWETIPAQLPFLNHVPAEREKWAAWLGPKAKPRVGVVWKGNPREHDPASNLIDRRRSLKLGQILPLLEAHPEIDFICLQKGHGETLPAFFRDPTSLIRDFADSAALVANLDLVITVDTSMAHLAGGLACPVWMLSRFDACWRWRDSGDQSPWYPGMRLFRQPRYGDWAPPLAALAEALAAWSPQPKIGD